MRDELAIKKTTFTPEQSFSGFSAGQTYTEYQLVHHDGHIESIYGTLEAAQRALNSYNDNVFIDRVKAVSASTGYGYDLFPNE